MDPRKRRALALQETSDNVSSVATPRTRVPGKTSKVPPNLAPLDAVLPEDMRLAHTSTTLELMQAHASTNETKKGDTRRQRDVRRWRDEAGEVRDAATRGGRKKKALSCNQPPLVAWVLSESGPPGRPPVRI